MKAEEIKKTTQYDHVSILATRYGEEVFIALNEGNPICEILDPNGPIGFEKKLDKDITLFGNIDSVYTLLYGSTDDVRLETLKQKETAVYGRFVISNGCPIAFDTPKENIRAMINA